MVSEISACSKSRLNRISVVWGGVVCFRVERLKGSHTGSLRLEKNGAKIALKPYACPTFHRLGRPRELWETAKAVQKAVHKARARTCWRLSLIVPHPRPLAQARRWVEFRELTRSVVSMAGRSGVMNHKCNYQSR